MTDIFADGFKEKPYWWEAAAPTAEGTQPLPEDTDVAIVGGGYAGLSAALELARNGVRATVIEKAEFGSGASTRNGGAVSSGITLGKGLSGGGGGSPGELLRGAADSFAHLETVIALEGIECHWQRSGRFVGAFTNRHFARMAALAETLNRYTDAGASVLPAARQREEIASDFYRGGLVIERSGKIHPSLYHRGLLEAARRAGATLCAHTAVHGVDRDGTGFVVKTSAGTVKAREVAMCTNGYTDAAAPALRRRIIPVASHIIATEPMEASLAASLFPNNRAVSETKRVLCYYRMSPDGRRLVFGGRARFTPVGATTSAPILHRFMTDRFPQLAGVKITHAWTGNVAFTFDFLPHMGRMGGIHYCMGCNGSGVAMMSYLGNAIGQKIVGGTNRVNPFDTDVFPDQMGYGGNPWFLPIVGAYYRARDRFERWRD